MPIVGSAITSAIIAAGPTLKGANWFQMAGAIGAAVAVWAKGPTNVTLVGTATGTVGAGQVIGKFFMVPSPLPVNLSVSAATLLGGEAQAIATAVGVGIATSINATAAYRGTSAGAGTPGVDASKVVFTNPATLATLLNARFRLVGLRGPDASLLASGLAPGIATMFLTGVGTGTVVGGGGPAPGVAVSKSSLF